MSQKKLPLINSAHGSDTRNIINELIKLFNNMGYTYNESLQKAQDILDEAQQTNDMNESVQQQINTLIAESGTSDAEVLQARIDAEGNEYTVLKDRLDESDTQLAQTEEQVPRFKRKTIETFGEPHLENFINTSFFTGATIRGKEVHIARLGMSHQDDFGETALVVYIRQDDGSFLKKKIEGIDYSIVSPDVDLRDPNLSVLPSGTVVLTIAGRLPDNSYTNYYLRLDSNYNVVDTQILHGMENRFCWGNTLTSSEGKMLKASYINGVHLFVNEGESGELDMQSIAEIFPETSEAPREPTIGYWGRKIVAVTRQNNGNMLYRETEDLTGRSGWGDIIDLGVRGHAPCILPYTPKDKPLILTASYEDETFKRSPFIKVVYDINNFSLSRTIFVDELNRRGGYNSLVPNRNGYGLMYYENGGGLGHTTSVFYKELNIDNFELNLANQEMLQEVNFYETGSWELVLDNTVNIESFGSVSGVEYTRIGRKVTGSFLVENVIPTTSGVMSFTFNLPYDRWSSSTIGGSLIRVGGSRNSSTYVTIYSGSDRRLVVCAIEATDSNSSSIIVNFNFIPRDFVEEDWVLS